MNPDNTIAIILTTLLRPELFKKTLSSILEHRQDNWQIFIADQGGDEDKAQNKALADSYRTTHPIHYEQLPYNCGLSYARNHLVEKVRNAGIPYTLLTADSILFTPSMQKIGLLLPLLHTPAISDALHFDIVGMSITNPVRWEGKLTLVEGRYFELELIDKTKGISFVNVETQDSFVLYECDVVRNFFIARTEVLYDVKWDDELYLAEHEDMFYRIKQAGYKVAFTESFTGFYQVDRLGRYGLLRRLNWELSLRKLKDKYHIAGWVHQKQ